MLICVGYCIYMTFSKFTKGHNDFDTFDAVNSGQTVGHTSRRAFEESRLFICVAVRSSVRQTKSPFMVKRPESLGVFWICLGGGFFLLTLFFFVCFYVFFMFFSPSNF